MLLLDTLLRWYHESAVQQGNAFETTYVFARDKGVE